jgi:hypothetical protein
MEESTPMKTTPRHRKIARTIWECGGRLEEAAQRENVRPDTLRRWLADGDFRALLAEDALEPILQATSAMLRWAPVAVARLIQDLEGESAADARQAAREIFKLALDTQRELARPAEAPPGDAKQAGGPSDDPLTQRVAALTDEQLARVLAVLNETKGDRR